MFAIAPTDINWFKFISSQNTPKLVNFWTPTPWNIKKLQEGDQLLFLLKAPYRKIAGYGTFKYYENMSAHEAWQKFGLGNGVTSLTELITSATGYSKIHSTKPINYDNPNIGCIVLENPVFFDEENYFKPEDVGINFPRQVVKLKYFNLELTQILEEENTLDKETSYKLVDVEKIAHKTISVKARKGQSLFRKNVFNAYKNSCAITGEMCSEVLEAAHIQQYINEDSNHIQNGLLLRSDIHVLFDAGLITFDNEYRVKVSPYLNSNYYQSLSGKSILLPKELHHRPSLIALELHNSEIFRK